MVWCLLNTSQTASCYTVKHKAGWIFNVISETALLSQSVQLLKLMLCRKPKKPFPFFFFSITCIISPNMVILETELFETTFSSLFNLNLESPVLKSCLYWLLKIRIMGKTHKYRY